ncbi:MAG: hypothetical protein IPP99_02705 [Chitinophagaceae bacterium]|nr:hypothetical protein [Chitinophagaceae bacterium]
MYFLVVVISGYVSEEVGITSLTIKYGCPDVNKKRRQSIWEGKLVTYGFSITNFITNGNTLSLVGWESMKPQPSVFEHDVKVEGKDIKAEPMLYLSP